MLATGTLVGLTMVYLGALFMVATLVDHGHARRWARHPLTTALALGVYATSWTFFGSVGFAASEGWRFLAIYVGATISCALVPIVWAPLCRLVRERQLASLADVFAFRYQSQGVGALVTVFLLAGSLPYQALQLRAAVEAVAELGGEGARGPIALATTGFLVVFGVVYGVRHLSPRERHDGFVAAVALESLVKLVALLAVAGYALYVLGGPSGVNSWLAAHPAELASMTRAGREPSWLALLTLGAAAIFLLPRQWQMGFTEGDPQGLRTASWALPLYLLLLNLAVPLVLWAGRALGVSGSPDFFVLGLARASNSTALAALVFLGALSASGAMIVVTTVALAGMVQNHVIVPLTGMSAGVYRRLRWLRRALVAGIILAGYGVYMVLAHSSRLVDVGLVSFVAVAQLVPGLVGVLVWPRATARGFALGLSAGIVGWVATPVIPLLARAGAVPEAWNWTAALPLDGDPWTFTTALTLGLNAIGFVVGSLWREPSAAERDAAAACRQRGAAAAGAPVEVAASPAEFARRLAPVLGEETAAAELDAARADLGLAADERRPDRLRLLRDRVEQNLSGLVGPVTARMIVDERLALDESFRTLVSAQLRYVEERMAAARLEGPARALEQARRFLRDVLSDLPVGVCALGPAGDVALWNQAMAHISGVAAEDVLERRLAQLGEPWGPTLADFAAGGAARADVEVDGGGRVRSLALHRATVESDALVLLVEDRTEQRELEARVAHQDRLASIGRLAAGVAHEIGNPLTGIASLAQNLHSEADNPDTAERLGLVLEQTRRIDRIVQSLLGFARAGVIGRARTATPVPVCVAEVVADAVTLARLGGRGRTILFDVDVPVDMVVPRDRQRLEQVVVNLLTNACDASPPGARVRIDGELDAEHMRLRVSDRGTGMSPEVRKRVFEPFFTTKQPGQGTGLGLTLVYSIVVEQGGTIDVASAPGEGTTVTVQLPILPGGGGGAVV